MPETGPAAVRHLLRRGAYCDSIVLLELQKALLALPGVEDAGAVMATCTNLDLLAVRGLLPEGLADAAPDDLLVVVRAATGERATAALAETDPLLARRRGEEGGDYRPRSLAAAVRLLPEARWVLVSVPGRWAARVAREALALGRHVFLFSDNVPLADEVALKEEAARRGLLVLGPDCGTAMLGGVGFGFANRVRRGGVGLVAASGTGLQAVASRLHALGAGVSHALGTGGRDLSRGVGGRTALAALDLLARDPATEVIVFLSKPPAAEVAERVLEAARATGKPVVVYFQGGAASGRAGLHFAASLEHAADLAAALLAERRSPQAADVSGSSPEAAPSPPPAGEGRGEGGYLRGLFSGGTLAYEALLALARALSPLRSNLKAHGVEPLADLARSAGHTVVDLGDDAFTVGRLHPMLDPQLLVARLRQEAADPAVGAILLDVVLGDGAHGDPAAELAPAIAEARAGNPDLAIVAIVVGTDEDPQGLASQRERLAGAGAEVVGTVGEAMARLGLGDLQVATAGTVGPGPRHPPVIAPSGPTSSPTGAPEAPPAEATLAALAPTPSAINVGLETFHASLVTQGAASVQVDWRPPAGGNERMLALLDRLRAGG